MKFTSRLATVSAVALLVGAAGASAATLDITSISASWGNVVPGAGVTNTDGDPTDSLRWGDPATNNGQSGYDFTRVATPVLNLAADTAFLIGTFTHLNNPVYPPSLESADLDVDISIASGPTVGSTFSFSHDETTNSSPCGFPSTSVCDDIVSVANAAGAAAFDIGGVSYVFQVLGFSTDGGTTILSDFQTLENANNTAQLYAKFTAETNVIPLPAAGWLLLGGLGGLAALRRRKKAA